MQDSATWQTSSECCNHMVPSGRTMNYTLFAQKIQIWKYSNPTSYGICIQHQQWKGDFLQDGA